MQNWIDIKKLDFTEYNPRQVRGDALERLKKSLGSENGKRLFEKRPCLANKRDGRIVVYAGNQRLRAAKELGWDKVPCDIDEISLEEERERNIKDNLVIGEWDDDILANNFDIQELEDWGVDLKELDIINEPDVEEDDVPEVPDEPRAKRGEIYQLGKHRLMCGDSTSIDDVEKLMDGKKADMVFTSPPYAVGIDYGEYEDSIENLREMLPKLSKLFLRFIDNGCFAVINFGDIAAAKNINETKEPCEYPMAIEYFPVFRSDGWLLWSRRIWCKPNPRVNSMQCISSNRAATDWEHIWTWKKEGDPKVKRVDGKSCFGWIDTTKDTGVEIGKETHGAGMATSIAVKMVDVHSIAGGFVLEPFCGTGTTLIACEQSNRICYGMEIEPKYCDVIIERYCNFTNTDKEEIYGKAEEANRLQATR